jgi:hypothetical protein
MGKERIAMRSHKEPHTPSVEDAERAERLREVLADLAEINRQIPVIVEGKKDARALRALGFVGEIITLNRGKSLYDFTEDLAERYHKIIILMDWDTRGEELSSRLGRDLEGPEGRQRRGGHTETPHEARRRCGCLEIRARTWPRATSGRGATVFSSATTAPPSER